MCMRITQKKVIPFQPLWTILKKAYDPLSTPAKHAQVMEFAGYQIEKKLNIDTENLIQQPLS